MLLRTILIALGITTFLFIIRAITTKMTPKNYEGANEPIDITANTNKTDIIAEPIKQSENTPQKETEITIYSKNSIVLTRKIDWCSISKIATKKVLYPITFIILMEVILFHIGITNVEGKWSYLIYLAVIPIGKFNTIIFQSLVESLSASNTPIMLIDDKTNSTKP